MSKTEAIIRFEDVSFKYDDKKVTLDEANFVVRRDSKMTIMGQNGAGKSTLFKLILGEIQPQEGQINIKQGAKIAIAKQLHSREELEMTIIDYFASAFDQKEYSLEKKISEVMKVVNFSIDLSKKVKELSGGQKARLLLAFALIQDPDILLLDEPTNNLDHAGIDLLTTLLIMYPKTCIVISHDADFLNTFTDGVLNLDIATHKVDQFVGNYFDVVEQIASQSEKERMMNARLEKSIRDRFDKVNKLGGKSVAMNRLARKIREDIAEDKEKVVNVRQDDKTIPEFEIPAQHCHGVVVAFDKVTMMHQGKVIERDVHIDLFRGENLIIKGPNGMGKTTLLRKIVNKEGVKIDDAVKIGYYSQDFGDIDFDKTALEVLQEVSGDDKYVQDIYGAAGRFMLPGEVLKHKFGTLSEGQKGLLCYARFMLQEPGLLVMDEPTNHINFRHIPVIAKALSEYKGTMILVSHLPDFVSHIKFDREIDLPTLAARSK